MIIIYIFLANYLDSIAIQQKALCYSLAPQKSVVTLVLRANAGLVVDKGQQGLKISINTEESLNIIRTYLHSIAQQSPSPSPSIRLYIQ
jgi:hypothetical protein